MTWLENTNADLGCMISVHLFFTKLLERLQKKSSERDLVFLWCFNKF